MAAEALAHCLHAFPRRHWCTLPGKHSLPRQAGIAEQAPVLSLALLHPQPPCLQAAQSPVHSKAGSRAASRAQQGPLDDWELFQAVLGKPRTAAQRQQFAAAWRDWQAASARAERGASSAGSSNSGGGTRGAWAGGTTTSGSADSGDGHGGSRSRGASSSSCWHGHGSAGASAGPRWGQANWSWADMRQETASSMGTAGWGDDEAWYEPPDGHSKRSGPRASSGGADSSRRRSGAAWGWHASWQHFFASSWQHAGWQHGGSGGAGSFGSGGRGQGSSISSATASSLQLLGLEQGWLATRCSRKLRACYLAKARALHPDVHAASGEHSAAAAEARFKEVQAAYEALLQMVSQPGPLR